MVFACHQIFRFTAKHKGAPNFQVRLDFFEAIVSMTSINSQIRNCETQRSNNTITLSQKFLPGFFPKSRASPHPAPTRPALRGRIDLSSFRRVYLRRRGVRNSSLVSYYSRYRTGIYIVLPFQRLRRVFLCPSYWQALSCT